MFNRKNLARKGLNDNHYTVKRSVIQCFAAAPGEFSIYQIEK